MSLNKISINDTTTVNTGIVYDISKAHNGATYTDLADAFGTNGANVPPEIREGGMSVRFVLTSDNNYVQYRLMADTWSTIVNDWQGVDEEPIPSSKNLVKSGGVYGEINLSLSKVRRINFVELGNRLDGSQLLHGHYWDSYFGVSSKTKLGLNETFYCLILEIKEGDEFNVVGAVSPTTAAAPVIFINKDFEIISLPSIGNLIAPADAAYVCFNTTESNSFAVQFKNGLFKQEQNERKETDDALSLKIKSLNYCKIGETIDKSQLLQGHYWDSYFGVSSKTKLGLNEIFYCLILEAKEGDEFNVVGAVSPTTAAVPVIFINKDFEIISLPSIGNLIAPADAAYVCFNTTTPDDFIVKFQGVLNPVRTFVQRQFTPADLYDNRYFDGYGQVSTGFGSNETFACLKLKVSTGDKFYIKAQSSHQAAPVIVCVDKNNNILYKSGLSYDGIFVVPQNAVYIGINSAKGTKNLFTAQYFGIYDSKVIKITVPKTFYAIKGLLKEIYYDNIINQCEQTKKYSIESTFVNIPNGASDLKKFSMSSPNTGLFAVNILSFNDDKELIKKDILSVNVLNNTNTNVKRVWCTGDSITEGQNVPYYIEQALHNILEDGSSYPVFVGSKGGSGGMGGKPTKHEAWWGRTYKWLSGMDVDKTSPLLNPSTQQLDIAYYRTNVLGLGADEHIEICSMGMGFNDSATMSGAEAGFTAMQAIIAAFKADYADTKFIVQLIPYMASGNCEFGGESRTQRQLCLEHFRELCLNAYNDNQDPNIIIGDFGLCYDRWLAYQKADVVSPYYGSTGEQIVTDRYHLTAQGAEQVGTNMAPAILKLLQE